MMAKKYSKSSINIYVFTDENLILFFIGAEIGLRRNYPDCRKCMGTWIQHSNFTDMLSFYRAVNPVCTNYADIISKGQLIWHDIRETKSHRLYRKEIR